MTELADESDHFGRSLSQRRCGGSALHAGAPEKHRDDVAGFLEEPLRLLV